VALSFLWWIFAEVEEVLFFPSRQAETCIATILLPPFFRSDALSQESSSFPGPPLVKALRPHPLGFLLAKKLSLFEAASSDFLVRYLPPPPPPLLREIANARPFPPENTPRQRFSFSFWSSEFQGSARKFFSSPFPGGCGPFRLSFLVS